MSRRGNNEGTISKRSDGRWEARLSLPNGKRKSLYGKTRAEVARKLTEARHAQDKGLPALNERQTVGQFLETWLDAIQHTMKPRSLLRYREHLAHLPIEVRRTAMVRLSPPQLQTVYNDLLDEGLSASTVRNLHMVVHRMLADAQRWGILILNVADRVEPPIPARPEMAVLNSDQAKAFLLAASGDRLEALYILALTTGMREGELLALTWPDIDLGAGVLSVHATLYYRNGQYSFEEPKTSHSRRSIRLSSLAIEALRDHQERQAQERARYTKVWDDTYELVFCNHLGGPINYANLLYYEFRPLLKKAGLPRIRFHDLRHTAATLLLKQGVHTKIVSEMLGHSRVSITMDIYSHVLPDMQDVAVKAMEKTFQFSPLSSELSSSDSASPDEGRQGEE